MCMCNVAHSTFTPFARFSSYGRKSSRQRGKGTFISDNEVMAYPEIPDVAHEFAARLQFGTTFELMEFLAQQQITLSQRMAKEHANMQMI